MLIACLEQPDSARLLWDEYDADPLAPGDADSLSEADLALSKREAQRKLTPEQLRAWKKARAARRRSTDEDD